MTKYIITAWVPDQLGPIVPKVLNAEDALVEVATKAAQGYTVTVIGINTEGEAWPIYPKKNGNVGRG